MQEILNNTTIARIVGKAINIKQTDLGQINTCVLLRECKCHEPGRKKSLLFNRMFVPREWV